jgi:hypothetical protein
MAVMQCSLLQVGQRFARADCLHYQSDGPQKPSNFYQNTRRNIPENIPLQELYY